jgi:hypothetical protein
MPNWIKQLASKLIRGAIAVSPLAGYKLQNAPLIWPPLGGLEIYAAGLAVALIGILGALPSAFRTKAVAKKWIGYMVVLAFASLISYGYLFSKYVIRVDTPNNGTQYRTIGSERTALGSQAFPTESPEKILEGIRLEDADIKRVWTPSSVDHARFELFISYVASLGFINFLIGAFTRISSTSSQQLR